MLEDTNSLDGAQIMHNLSLNATEEATIIMQEKGIYSSYLVWTETPCSASYEACQVMPNKLCTSHL